MPPINAQVAGHSILTPSEKKRLRSHANGTQLGVRVAPFTPSMPRSISHDRAKDVDLKKTHAKTTERNVVSQYIGINIRGGG